MRSIIDLISDNLKVFVQLNLKEPMKRLLLLSFITITAIAYGTRRDIVTELNKQQKEITEYPALPIRFEKSTFTLPFVTMFPTNGDSAVASKQLLAGTENFLRENRTINRIENGKQKIYGLVHETNYGQTGDVPPGHFKQFLKKSPLIIGTAGVESFLSIEDSIKRKKAALFFPFIATPLVRDKSFENVIYFRPSHKDELKALADYAIKKKHKTMVGILYESSKVGLSTLSALKETLAAYDIMIVGEVSYPQGTVDVARAVKELSKKNPNVVFLLARPRPAYTFIINAINTGLHEALYVGPSSLHSIQHLLKSSRGIDITITEVVPNAKTEKTPLIESYKKDMESFLSYKLDSPYYLESYICMKLFLKIIGQAKAVNIKSMLDACETMTNFNLDGLELTFDPQTRTFSKNIWINPGDEQPWIKIYPEQKDATKEQVI